MGFLDIFRSKESDSELQKLLDFARASTSDPERHVALALAYVERFKTPPNWSDDYAKKAVNAFRKAVAIAKKQMPIREGAIRNHLIETFHEVATAYYTYHIETQPDSQWLETAIWLFEQIQSESQSQPMQASKVREGLKDCWFEVVVWREKKLEDEATDERDLQVYLTAVERAMSYYDVGDSMRNAIDHDAAGEQLVMGSRYLERAQQSAVLGRKNNLLLNVNDQEHKEYARQAIRLLRDGRTRLEPYTSSENYTEHIAGANEALAVAYIILYNLTLAHSKHSQSIGLLEEGVQVVPGDADLWATFAEANERLMSEVIDEYNRRPSVNVVVDAADRMRTDAKVNSLKKKALECYQKARQLAPDKY